VSIGIVNDALMRSGAKTINDVLPYHKYMRQDRRAAPRSPITAKVAADMIQTYGNSVITTDVHNAATESAYRIPFENLKAFSYIINQIKERHPDFLENTILMAPDANSAKNTEIYARKLGVGMAIAHKVRDKSGIDSMTLIGNVKDKNVLIVDDMIDTGGTMRTAAEKIKEGGGRNIYACATHGLFSGDARKAFEASELEKIIVTNSIPQKSAGKIEVVPLEGLFSEVIYRMSHGESISEMYQK